MKQNICLLMQIAELRKISKASNYQSRDTAGLLVCCDRIASLQHLRMKRQKRVFTLIPVRFKSLQAR